MRFRKNSEANSESYWQPATDMMAGLLLVILLIMALLLLYITQVEEDHHEDGGSGGATHEEARIETMPTENHNWDNNDSGGGGGEGETTAAPTEAPYDGEDYSKAAVHVTVVDGETEKVIRQKGISFELLNANNSLKKLNTYYPEKIEYSQFETTDDGTFYLPEKIRMGQYAMKSISVPEQYEEGRLTQFELTEPYDWPDPYELEIPLLPSKNIIRVQSNDAETGKHVPGCVYEVIAEEDVTTLDGTVRYVKNEKVDVIECDSEGYGESIELYLGKYKLRQTTAAEYYALNGTPVVAEVESRKAADTPVHTVKCDKTKINLTLIDEYTEEALSGAVFSVEGRDDLKTDESGSLTLTDLAKDTTYILKVKSLPEGYKMNETSWSCTVDKNGYIDDEPVHNLNLTSYITRINLSVRDILLKNELSGNTLTLYDENDNVAANIETNGTVQTVSGLEPGTYTVEANGKKSTRITVQINDDAKPTDGCIYLWTTMDFVMIFAALLMLGIVALIMVMIIRKRREKKPNAK